MRTPSTVKLLGVLALASLALAACTNADPLAEGGQTSTTTVPTGNTAADADQTIVVGSQDYYSNEIIAEVYAQALEAKGLKVAREFRIGQREAYIDEIESGKIDLFPEYTGPLLRYWKPDSTATKADEVYTELQAATPNGLMVLAMAQAADQDSYVVTKAFADKYGITSIADLTKVSEPLTMGANAEAERRPFGPKGLKEKFGLEVKFTPIEDGGGPLTVKALKDNTVQMAVIYSASPQLLQANDAGTPASEQLVTLTDDKGLFTASNVVALGSSELPQEAVATINGINAALTTDALIAMNDDSVRNQRPAKDIAQQWLADHSDRSSDSN